MADFLPAIKGKLESKEDVVECLDTLNALLISNTSASQISEILSAIPLSTFFLCLQSDDSDQLNLTCALLEKLLSQLQASEVLQNSKYVELGLQYPEAKVPAMCLQMLLRLCADEAMKELVLAPTTLHLITQLLGNDLQCASLASKVLLHYSATVLEGGLKSVWCSEVDVLLLATDTVRYRVYDLLVKICLQGGTKCFTVVRSCGYLNQLVNELESTDPLVKMNCIELLSCLAACPEGTSFLQTSQVLDRLYHSFQTDAMGLIVIPAILKFFGQLCIYLGAEAVQICDKYPKFLSLTLEAALSPDDDTLWGVSIDTFGLLASTLSGRTLLLAKQDATEKVLKKLGELVSVAPSEVRCRSLEAVKMLVSCSEECHWEVSTSRQWCATIHHNFLQLLLSIVKQPFSDLRLCGLGVMLEMCGHEWGQREMQCCSGFLEYVLDRNTESDKEGKDLKYEIVHRMVASEYGGVVWGNVNMMKMKMYDQEGPYFQRGDTSVAIEGAS